MAIQVYGGETVRILTSGGEVDPNTYKVDFIRRSVVGLINQKTNIEVKVHRSRIHEIVEDNNMNDSKTDSESTSEATATDQTETPQAVKPKKVRKPKAKPEPINFATMASEGFQIWTKDVSGGLGTDPKVKGIKVQAVCMIAPDKSGYEVFNTYNDTRGKKGKSGKVFNFSDKSTLEKKQRQLQNKGYKHIFAQVQVVTQEEDETVETDQTEVEETEMVEITETEAQVESEVESEVESDELATADNDW